MLLGLYVLASRSQRTADLFRRNRWVFVLFAYMTLSIFWSNFPGISLRRCLRSIGTLVMVLVVLTEPDPFEALRALLRRLYMVHIPLSIAAIKYFRSVGVVFTWDGAQEMWVGLAVHKNNLGQVAMCSGLVFFWQVLRNWARKKFSTDLLLLVPTLWVLCGSKTSHSSTAILGFIISATLLLGLQFVKRKPAHAKRIVLSAALAIALLAPLAYFASELLDTMPTEVVFNATGRDMTLSDRTYLWADVLENAARTPILGVGYGAFWVGSLGYDLYPFPRWSRVTHTWRPGEGHNGYIDVYADLGLIGVALIVLVIGSAVGGALDDLQNRFEFGRLRLILLLSILVNNVAESSFLNGTHSLWFVFLLAAINTPAAIPRRCATPRRAPGRFVVAELQTVPIHEYRVEAQ